MGAKCVFDISAGEASASMVEREVKRRVEAQTGRYIGSWEVLVSTHAPQDKKQAPIQTVTFSDTPDRVYVIFSNLVSEVEPTILPLMRKISGYVPRITRAIRGSQYDFDDFCVRVGLSFDRHNTSSGVVVEIEYRPCTAVSECEGLMTDLMERIAASLVPPAHSTQDHAINQSANMQYPFARVVLDDTKLRPADTHPFSNRTAALLYSRLLRTV